MEYSTQVRNQEVYDCIEQYPCAVLATVNKEGVPELAHVIAHADEQFHLYFVSREKTRKIANLATHPAVSLLFSSVAEMRQIEYVGTAELIDDMKEIAAKLPLVQRAMAASQSSYQLPPVSQIGEEGYVLVRVTPSRILYRDYSHGTEHPEPTEYPVRLQE